jgi:peroxiredoxin
MAPVTGIVHDLFAENGAHPGSQRRGNGLRLGAFPPRVEARRRRDVQQAHHAAARVVGARIPDITLKSVRGGAIEMAFLTRNAAIIYFYPGLFTRTDAAQARAFRDKYGRLLLLGYQLFGVHAQHPGHQLQLIADGVEHFLCADPGLLFAHLMGVPTYLVGPARVYRPMTLVVEGSKVAHAFSPLDRPGESATQLLAWLEHFRPEGAVSA